MIFQPATATHMDWSGILSQSRFPQRGGAVARPRPADQLLLQSLGVDLCTASLDGGAELSKGAQAARSHGIEVKSRILENALAYRSAAKRQRHNRSRPPMLLKRH